MTDSKTVFKKVIDSTIKTTEQISNLDNAEMNRECVDGKIIGTGRPDYTQDSEKYSMFVKNKEFLLVDVPGIEGNESKFENTINESIEKAHAIFYVNGSGKKIESKTLEKIKRYMRDGTSVYAIFNVHHKGKSNRDISFDGTYKEELLQAYKKETEIVAQTEKELKSFLGKNYKKSVILNGLLAFCGMAINSNTLKSTIVQDDEKKLRSYQKTFLNEYNHNISELRSDSRIAEITNIINDKVEHFKDLIEEENKKKLKNRLKELIEKITKLQQEESKKITKFQDLYEEFDSNCELAKEDFLQKVRLLGSSATSEVIEDLRDKLFKKIENDDGKTKDKEIKAFFEKNTENLESKIQKNINKLFASYQQGYEDNIKDAQDRLLKDFEKTQEIFKISIQNFGLELDTSFLQKLKYNLKDLGKHTFTIASLSISGGLVGSAIVPGIGTAIGAVIGGLLGILSDIWNWFVGKGKRVAHAKEKLGKEIDKLNSEISAQINAEIKKLKIDKKINEDYDLIHDTIQKQSAAFGIIEKTLNEVRRILLAKSKEI